MARSALPNALWKIGGLSTDEREEGLDRLLFGHIGGIPIVEGNTALFLYRGVVKSGLYVAGDFNGWEARADPMLRIEGTDLHCFELELPPDARLEYKFVRDGEWILDPLNPKSACGKFGCNSVLTMPKYRARLAGIEDSRPRGKTQEFDLRSRISGTRWSIRLYGPSDREPIAALVVLDGSDYLEFAKMAAVLDWAISAHECVPVVSAFVDSSGREVEYAMPRSCCQVIADEIVPLVRVKGGLSQDTGAIAVMGAAQAGLVSALSALTYPNRIGKAAAQSGLFTGRGYELVMSALTSLQGRPTVYLDCGSFETNLSGHGSIVNATRAVAAALRSRGCEVRSLETNEGHNWTAWRNRLPGLLSFLFKR